MTQTALRIASYNIRKARGLDQRRSPERIVDVINGLGADVVAVNHPYSEYGYFTSHEKGVVPGDFDDGFDLVEISTVLESSGQPVKNRETLERAWQMWNDGLRKYLVAGSDVHDVWSFASARARTYAYVEGELTIEKFIESVRSGHSYASQGPLVFPEILFGSDVALASGETLDLRAEIQAVTGLKSVQLIERGSATNGQEMAGERDPVQIEFSVNPESDTWYSLVVEDMSGKIAYTNPVWVSIVN